MGAQDPQGEGMTKNRVTIKDVYDLVEGLRDEVREVYVTKGEFLPVKMIAYSIVGVASAAVLTALLAQVVVAGF